MAEKDIATSVVKALAKLTAVEGFQPTFVLYARQSALKDRGSRRRYHHHKGVQHFSIRSQNSLCQIATGALRQSVIPVLRGIVVHRFFAV